jgi:hypothetical protein
MVRRIKLTPHEKERYEYMVDLFGGEKFVDKAKIRRRILSQRKLKGKYTTARQMEDIFGY